MRTWRTIVVGLVGIFAPIAFASHFTGTYQNEEQGITLIIQHSSDTQMQGVMIGSGIQFQLQGQGDERGAQGVFVSAQGQVPFQAQLSPDGGVLQLAIQQPGAAGQPGAPGQPGTSGQPGAPGGQQLLFRRTSHEATMPGGPPPSAPPTGPTSPMGPTSPPPGSAGSPLGQPPLASPPMSSQPGAGNPLLPGQASPPASSDPWTGVYNGDGGRLVVSIQATGQGAFGGYIESAGSRFPLQARDAGSHLEGAFQSPDGTFEFALEQGNGVVHFYTGGTEYVLTKQGGTIAPGAMPSGGGNPLDGPR